MEYPGMQYQPGFAPPPSTMGYMAGGMGYGGLPLYQQQQAQQQAGMGLGAGALNFGTSALPGMLGSGAMFAGVAGNFLEAGGYKKLGFAMNMLDPSSWALEAGARAAPLGYSVGSAFGSAMGMGGFGAGAMGVLGGGAAALGVGAPIAAATYGAYKGGQFVMNNLYQGGQNYLAGQGFANMMGPSVAPGMSMQNQGMSMGNMLRDISGSTGLDTSDISRIAKEMDAQKLFQTSKDMKEFKDKFTTAMKAVKEIASLTKTSIDDAVKMFGDLRAQGFYNTADVSSQAALTQARAATTGLSYDTMNAVGGAGAQTARGYGMRGRFGAGLAQRNVAGVASAVRSGAVSEEEVMEMGGVEAVGMRQAQQQMGFLSSSRGTAFIAAMMGKDGAPDQAKLRAALGGNMSLEDLVTRAAGSGIGTLRQAQGREAREAMMPYSDLIMLRMASMQSQQLYGKTSKKSLIGMLGTMGVGGEEAEVMLGSVQQRVKQMRDEQVELQNQGNREAAEARRSRRSFSGQIDEYTASTAESLQNAGGAFVENISNEYQRMSESLFGERTMRGGDDESYRRARANKNLNLQTSGRYTDTLLGGGAAEDIKRDYYGLGKTSKDLGLSDQDIQKKVASGELIDIGGEGLSMGKLGTLAAIPASGGLTTLMSRGANLGRLAESGNMYVSRSDLEKAEKQTAEGRAAVRFGTEDQQERLNRFFADSRNVQNVEKAYQEKFGYGSSLAGSILGATSIIGIGKQDSLAAQTQKNEFSAFYVAQQTGMLSQNLSFEDFQKDPGGKYDKRGTLAQLRAQASGQKSAAVQGMFGKEAGGGAGALDLQNAVAERDRTIQDFMGKFGSQGMFGSGVSFYEKGLKTQGSASSQASSLGAALSTDGTVRDLYRKFGELLSRGTKKGAKTEDSQNLRAVMEALIKALGEDSAAAREVKDQYSRAQENEDYGKNLSTDIKTLDESFQRGAAKEKLHELQQKGQSALQDFIKGGGDSGTVAKVQGLIDASSGTGGFAGREKAFGDLVKHLGSDEKGLTPEDRSLLSSVTEGGGGGGYADLVNQIMGGDLSGLEGKTLTPGQKEALGSKDVGKIVDTLTELGASGDVQESTKGGEKVEGSEGDYKKANQDFIDAVASLVSKLEKVGVIPKAAGENGEVATTGGGFGFNLNFNWGG